jgi:KH domain
MQADRAEQSIDVPRYLHRYLTGSGGARIREFQAKYHVTVELDKALNKAIVRGAMMDVNQAIEELRQV